MTKRYLKDESGRVRAVTSETLNLEKPLLNENYDISVHNRNMDKIDVAINNVKNEVSSMEFTSTKVIRPNQQTVEEAISANETSILNLQNQLGQNITLMQEDINVIRGVL